MPNLRLREDITPSTLRPLPSTPVDTVKNYMRTNEVFQGILGGATVATPHAEHHALYWAIKELGVTLADLNDETAKYGAVYGLLPADLEVVDGKAVRKAGKVAGPRSPCSVSSGNDQACLSMLRKYDVKVQ
ncbi:hypothetical protein N0V93_007068 [Gnomoniopsis smithogilvyi]|uniref:Uncharacterized protein n=1 Tax=Gnomoniopsis smithogilvyi TaxID=1191159 RepID=A0A9W8YQV2_9PEZI|nr:hypothetical protein N0V93_007068 [Gnomoniopsis smithogilvyi]